MLKKRETRFGSVEPLRDTGRATPEIGSGLGVCARGQATEHIESCRFFTTARVKIDEKREIL
jgi:hypothetical protein